MTRAGHALDRAGLLRIVAEDGRHIRAVRRRSVAADLGFPPFASRPLFHGTAKANLDAIPPEGIKPGHRQHVHLSADATAERVGQRHGQPVMLRVNAGAMHRDGHAFMQADNSVWLTAHVPSRYLGLDQGIG